MTKINVISGFLGAGKTTLIKKLLAEVFGGQKVVLIENEFGEIGIDGGFLKEAGVQITEMNSGCICCSLVGDFGKALREVLEKFSPDRIIIEPSGVGKLSDVVRAVENVAKDTGVELDSSVTVADATKCRIYMKNFGEFFNNQIEYADIIVLSRTQSMKEEKLEAAVSLLQEHNSKAAVITTPWDELDGSIILKAMNGRNALAEELMREEREHHEECDHDHHHDHDHHDGECDHDHDHDHDHHDGECDHDHDHDHDHHDGECGCGHDHHDHAHHHADEVFTSWGKETPHKFDRQDLGQTLEILANETGYGTILRAKGIVEGTDGSWIQFDLVPGEYEVRQGSPDYTGRLCVIGSDLKTEELSKLFHLE